MDTGRGSHFRRPSTLEVLASKASRLLPEALRARLRGAFARTLSAVDPGSLVATLPGGERVRLLPALRSLSWNQEEYEAFRRDVRPGDVVFDVGANLGAYTLLFAQWVGPTGRVFAFEPAAAPFAGLNALLAENGVSSRVTAVSAAVSGAEGTVTFLADAADGETRITTREGAGTVTVPITTIDVVCRREGMIPRLIKIDAEGAELDVLQGARETIAAAGKDLRLYVEMHPHLWAENRVTREAILEELEFQQLRAERLDGHPDIWNIEGVCLRLRPCGS